MEELELVSFSATIGLDGELCMTMANMSGSAVDVHGITWREALEFALTILQASMAAAQMSGVDIEEYRMALQQAERELHEYELDES